MRPAEARLPDAPPGVACAHCGLPVPPALAEPRAARAFCCAGCRAVFAVLQEHGLASFYDLRRREGAPARPARTSDRSYGELDDAGFRARTCRPDARGLLTTELYLEGVHCAACVWLVERLPALVPGVAEARLDLGRSRARLAWDPREVELSVIARRLDSLGYPVHPFRGADAEALARREDRALLMRIGVAGAVAGNVMVAAFGLYGGMLHGIEPQYSALLRWTSLAMTLPSFLWCGSVFFRGARAALAARALNMDVPIAVGLAAGFAHGVVNTLRGSGEVYFDAVSALIFLLLAGRWLQRRQQRAAADAAQLLAALAPSSARLLEGGAVREVPLETLVPGMLVELRAGDTVPADGRVVLGRSSLDSSWLTGESRPVDVAPGDAVHAGTVNLTSRLEMCIESAGEDTRVGRLMRLVEEHTKRRARIVQLADRLAGAFSAAVLILAAVTFALWWGRDPSAAFDHAVALLIVTCPCALALATPLALAAAIGRAARAGILVRGGDALERLARPGRVWLDKTGTLTEGRLAVVEFRGSLEARRLAAALEAHSAHPVARAIVAAETCAGSVLPRAFDVAETAGRGIEGEVEGRRVAVGSPEFVAARAGGLPPELAACLEAWADAGRTPVAIAVAGVAVAAAALGDPLRAGAREAVTNLAALGLRPGILSGDHPAVVRSVARALDVPDSEAHGGVTPEAKLATVLDARARGPVLMVGDGVNDAAALAAATVGVAVHGGAEAALAAADVFVTRPGVEPVVELVEGARRTLRVVRRNLAFSLLYNVAGIAAAMSGVLDPLVAAVLMPASSLTVIASSYRARTFDPPRGRRWR